MGEIPTHAEDKENKNTFNIGDSVKDTDTGQTGEITDIYYDKHVGEGCIISVKLDSDGEIAEYHPSYLEKSE